MHERKPVQHNKKFAKAKLYNAVDKMVLDVEGKDFTIS